VAERTLEEFVDWWWETRTFLPPVDSPVLIDGSISGVVLYRDAPFQVQLFIIAPGVEIPDHVHPNVDSYEIYFSGQIEFRRHGRRVTGRRMWPLKLASGHQALFGHRIRVDSVDSHGGTIGPAGGSFLSLQCWRADLAPTNVGDDWRFVGPEQRSRNFVKDLKPA
jgi:hypothetical protein